MGFTNPAPPPDVLVNVDSQVRGVDYYLWTPAANDDVPAVLATSATDQIKPAYVRRYGQPAIKLDTSFMYAYWDAYAAHDPRDFDARDVMVMRAAALRPLSSGKLAFGFTATQQTTKGPVVTVSSTGWQMWAPDGGPAPVSGTWATPATAGEWLEVELRYKPGPGGGGRLLVDGVQVGSIGPGGTLNTGAVLTATQDGTGESVYLSAVYASWDSVL